MFYILKCFASLVISITWANIFKLHQSVGGPNSQHVKFIVILFRVQLNVYILLECQCIIYKNTKETDLYTSYSSHYTVQQSHSIKGSPHSFYIYMLESKYRPHNQLYAQGELCQSNKIIIMWSHVQVHALGYVHVLLVCSRQGDQFSDIYSGGVTGDLYS